MRLRRLLLQLRRKAAAGIGWNDVGMLVSVALVVTALVVMYVMVRDLDLGGVMAAAMGTSPWALLAACAFVCVGYCTLTLYDYFALQALGRYDIPYTTAGLAGFAAYAIGHGLGMTVFTGNAVRLRIYSRWGLGVIDVAKIAFLTGLSFWLGNVCTLGFALAFTPSVAVAVTHLPSWANQALGLAALIATAAYLVWLLPRPRAVGVAAIRVELPDARLTSVQIGIGIIDLVAGSLATYVLLPALPSTDYAVIAVAYVIAALVGFLSHAPGSLGVFEVAMLVMLPQYRKEELLASLLILHVLYYVLPFLAALVMFAVREIRSATTMSEPNQLGGT